MVKRKLCSKSTAWIEKCIPQTPDDLAVQKKKINEVDDWLKSCFKQPNKAQILLLVGPPGAGKTATVQLLSRALKAELLTWSNSDLGDFQTPSCFLDDQRWPKTESQISYFSHFLLRSGKYSLFADARKIILVEEFPNVFLKNAGALHDILRKYVVFGKHPLVFIISDDTKGESIENRLFPSDLKFALKITNISFNPITQAKLVKALTRINDSVQFESHHMKLSKSQLEEIASNSIGDIRNAVNSLQFISISNFKKPKSVANSKGNSSKDQSGDVQRDSSLFLFHALGKILYCKRDKSIKSTSDALPDHLKHLERDPTQANPEEVFEKTALSADAFALFLQENCLSFIPEIKVAADSLYWFSEADLYSSYSFGHEGLGDYVASLSSRGLMFNMTSMTGNTWRPLHKPQLYDSNKKRTQLMVSLRRTFRDNFLSFREFQTEIVPFMQKIKSASLRSDQSTVISQIGEMKVKRFFRPECKTLKEKEVLKEDDEDFELSVEKCDGEEAIKPEQYDEEIVIEEYDF